MGASELPKDLARVRSRFQAWRQRRQAGSRIPDLLWQLAVGLVGRHGLSRTAIALGVDYYRLKKHVEKASAQPPSSGPAFVEVPALLGKQCLFELANGAGATKRVQLTGYEAAEVAVLARGFWSGQ